MKIISEKEYLEAISVVRAYHSQIENEIEAKNNTIENMTLHDWAKTHPEMSVRLQNILIHHVDPSLRLCEVSKKRLPRRVGLYSYISQTTENFRELCRLIVLEKTHLKTKIERESEFQRLLSGGRFF